MALSDGWHELAAVDRATLFYLVIVTLAVLLSLRGDDPPRWAWLLVAHALLALLVMVAPRARRAGALGRFLGDWYPMLLLGGLYGEIGVLTLDAGVQHDWMVQRWEAWLFGTQVSYDWIRAMPSPVLSGVMHACYLAYYPMLYASPVGLWLSRRHDAARHTILAVMITFYVCYTVFIFFPVAGPRYAFELADNAATGIWVARAVQWILNHGDSWGAAFPSSHVAASVVATAMALRYWRPLGLVLLPFAVGLTLAVVYGQFHYGIDALVGVSLAAAMLALVRLRPPALAALARC